MIRASACFVSITKTQSGPGMGHVDGLIRLVAGMRGGNPTDDCSAQSRPTYRLGADKWAGDKGGQGSSLRNRSVGVRLPVLNVDGSVLRLRGRTSKKCHYGSMTTTKSETSWSIQTRRSSLLEMSNTGLYHGPAARRLSGTTGLPTDISCFQAAHCRSKFRAAREDSSHLRLISATG